MIWWSTVCFHSNSSFDSTCGMACKISKWRCCASIGLSIIDNDTSKTCASMDQIYRFVCALWALGAFDVRVFSLHSHSSDHCWTRALSRSIISTLSILVCCLMASNETNSHTHAHISITCRGWCNFILSSSSTSNAHSIYTFDPSTRLIQDDHRC